MLLSLIPHKQFYLFGSPISASPSPLLHNTAFNRCGYPWVYSKMDTIEIDRVAEVVKGTSFGGASVTIPLKEQVGVLCQALSPAAQRIGAVNTLVRRGDGTLYGDNTDWLGIYRLLHPLIPSLNPADAALVIGAGGTARAALYALIHLGFSGQRLLVHNPRTPAHAVALAKEFTGVAVERLGVEGVGGGRGLRVVVGTLPAGVGWEAGEGVLGKDVVVLDANYVPWQTKLIGQAEKTGGTVVRGLDMLLEQGLAQFEIWTGREWGGGERGGQSDGEGRIRKAVDTQQEVRRRRRRQPRGMGMEGGGWMECCGSSVCSAEPLCPIAGSYREVELTTNQTKQIQSQWRLALPSIDPANPPLDHSLSPSSLTTPSHSPPSPSHPLPPRLLHPLSPHSQVPSHRIPSSSIAAVLEVSEAPLSCSFPPLSSPLSPFSVSVFHLLLLGFFAPPSRRFVSSSSLAFPPLSTRLPLFAFAPVSSSLSASSDPASLRG